MGRFVIQMHTIGAGRHYDLMLEVGPALATWRLDRLPAGLGGHDSLLAEALKAHRLAYLTHQGPVGRGRGSVRIADGGACRILVRADGLWVFRLAGRGVRGTFSLRRLAGSRWQLAAVSEGRGRRGS